jgi:hypothetical protein
MKERDVSMNGNTSATWNTKYGPRRVRHDPPTLAEAIAAAQDLTDQLDEQVEIAASLMGISREQAMADWPKTAPRPKLASSVTFTATRTGVQRAVIVERKPSRRIAAGRPAPVRKPGSAG